MRAELLAAGVDELHLAAPGGGFAVVDEPDVGGDAGVVEQVVGHGHDGVEPVVFEDVLADVARAAARVAVEQRRAVEDDGELRAVRGELAQLVQQKEHRAVAHVGQARPVAARRAACVLGLDFLADVLPVLPEGWIGEHVVELFAGQQVVAEGVLAFDVLRVFALHQHVGLGRWRRSFR